MSDAATILLSDAALGLQRRVSELKGRNDLPEAFAMWLSSASGPDRLGPLADLASRRVGGQRSYADVAILGYAADRGAGSPAVPDALASGLDWLTGRPALVGGAPTGLVTDGTAALGVALGSRAVGGLRVERVRVWLESIAAATRGQTGIPAWQRFLFATASRLLQGQPAPETDASPELSDLQLALTGRGLFRYRTPEEEAAAAVLVLQSARAEGGHVRSHQEAAIRLAALDWIRRDAPLLIPGQRATPAQVCELLRRVPAALQRWTWESSPRTRGGAPRQWQIDHEYHVQNLLWAVLAPVFPDLRFEENTPSIGQKHPRADLCIPSSRLIIEVKFIRAGDLFARMLEEIAADAALYFGAGSAYDEMIVFAWDDSRRSEEHDMFVRGVRELPRVRDAVVVSRPGSMVSPAAAGLSGAGRVSNR